MDDLVEKMIVYRVKNNLTQQKFAEKMGMSRATICNIENGKIKPKKTTELKILLFIEGKLGD